MDRKEIVQISQHHVTRFFGKESFDAEYTQKAFMQKIHKRIEWLGKNRSRVVRPHHDLVNIHISDQRFLL